MDLATAEAKLLAWQNADTAVTSGQAYSIDGMSLTRVDGDLITRKINYWQKVVNDHIDKDSGRTPGVRVASWN